ncbi:retrovirus-related pol polyprotein from transposon TNT 1-94, partial [Tanacetum coccineum]
FRRMQIQTDADSDICRFRQMQIQTDADLDGCRFRQMQIQIDSDSNRFRQTSIDLDSRQKTRFRQQIQIQADNREFRTEVDEEKQTNTQIQQRSPNRGKIRDGGLFYFEDILVVQVFKTTTTRSFDIWHKRLGHPSLKVTSLLPVVRLDKNSEVLSQTGDVGHHAKQCRDKFPVSEYKVSYIFELVHLNLLVNKSEVFNTIKLFMVMVERQFNKQVEIVRSDNGISPINLNDDEIEDLDTSFNRKGNSEIPVSGNDESLSSSNNPVNDGDESSQDRVNIKAKETQEEELGRKHRKKEASVRLHDYIAHTIHKETPSPSSKPAQSSSSGTPYPIAYYVNCDKFSVVHRNFLKAIDVEKEPSTYYEASKDKRCRLAMDNELQALEHNKTWIIEEPPKGKRALSCSSQTMGTSSDGWVEVARAKEGIFLSQRKYALDIILEFGLLGARPAFVPVEQNHCLGLAKDLVCSVHILSQFMQEPRIEHWEAALRVV